MKPGHRPIVERRVGPSTRDSKGQERVRQARMIKAQARERVRVAIDGLLDGCEGPFRAEVLAAILSIGADLSAKHIGAAETCSGLGLHAGRVGDQLTYLSGRDQAEARLREGSAG